MKIILLIGFLLSFTISHKTPNEKDKKEEDIILPKINGNHKKISNSIKLPPLQHTPQIRTNAENTLNVISKAKNSEEKTKIKLPKLKDQKGFFYENPKSNNLKRSEKVSELPSIEEEKDKK